MGSFLSNGLLIYLALAKAYAKTSENLSKTLSMHAKTQNLTIHPGLFVHAFEENVVHDCWICGDPGRAGAPTPFEELLFSSLLLLLFPWFLGGAPIIVEMAAANAAVKFGSEAMAAVTVSTMEAGRCPNCNAGDAVDNLEGPNIGFPKSCG